MDKGPSHTTSESWFCFQRKLRSLFSRALTQNEKTEDTTYSHQALCCPQRTLSTETREGGGHLVHIGGDCSTVSRQVLLLLQPLRVVFGSLVHWESPENTEMFCAPAVKRTGCPAFSHTAWLQKKVVKCCGLHVLFLNQCEPYIYVIHWRISLMLT